MVGSSESLAWCLGMDYQGQIIEQDTSFQYSTDLIWYDSIHFVHLDVVSPSDTTIFAEVSPGDYYEGVLIEGDTTLAFTYLDQFGCDRLVYIDLSVLTDLKTIYFPNIDVYPNPVNQHLMVVHHENEEAQYWSLHNSLGNKLWQEELPAHERLNPIDLEHLPTGVYWLRVETASNYGIWKIIKENP